MTCDWVDLVWAAAAREERMASSVETNHSYKRSHSAMNSKVVLPAFSIKGGKADLSGVNSAEGVASDVMELAQQLSFVGELYVFDADAEAGDLDMNKGVLDSLLDKMPVRIGGGFSTNDRVYDWLDKGATQVEVAYRESNLGFLDGVPRERITISVRMEGISAGDDLTVEGGKKLSEAMEEISYYGKHLLVRYEGASESFRETISAAKAVVKAGIMMCVQASCITPDDIAWLDSQGMETILCDQILNGSITLGQALGAALVSDRPDGLIPTVVVDEDMVSLGLCYSKRESLNEAVNRKVGVYWSRTRGLWIKGLTSGATQELIRVDLDCDRDSMRFVVRQTGVGFCHMEQMSCFGEDHGTLGALMRTLIDRKENAPAGSYTKRLFDDSALLKSKLLEECEELLAADNNKEVAFETADVIYFAFAACARHGVNLAEVQRSLARKHLRVRRRPGNAKPPGWKPGDPSPDAPTV